MGRNKTIGILVIVLLALAGIMYGQRYLADRSTETDTYIQYFSGLNRDEVNSVSLATPGATLTIHKQGSHQWQVNGYAADSTKMEDLLTKLTYPTDVSLVSENPATYDSLGITMTSTVLTINYPTGSKTMTIGAPTTGGRYIQLGQNGAVYLVNDLPATPDSVQLGDWVDKIITRIDQNSISQITITTATGSTVIKKNETGWVNAKDQIIDTTPFNPMLMTLESLVTTGLLDPEKATVLPKTPTITVQVERFGLNPVKLFLYSVGEEAAIQVDGQPGVYALNSSGLKTFEITPADLKPKSE